MQLNVKDTFNKELPADSESTNRRRQVLEACYSYVTPRIPSAPTLLHWSEEMATSIGITNDEVQSTKFLDIFSGRKVYPGTTPFSMCYGGHQFGHWAGQLGDGRAINLMEVEHEGQQWALQLKGAGETPYSRSADGLAVLRSSIREHLCSEAVYHLGVPTTRSLSLMLTGDQVMRDMLYDGNPAYEKGAVVCRVAPSFIRFGNFEIFSSRGDEIRLRELADYTIRHFFPTLKGGGKKKYAAFFAEVCRRTLRMVIAWQRVGFVHGVMNTDNMSILGLTIDYGPYGWLEGYDSGWTPNTTDRQHKRYRYGNQPNMALWNLMQLANALYPLIGEADPLQEALDEFHGKFPNAYLGMMGNKLGLIKMNKERGDLVNDLLPLLQEIETDMTLFFRELAQMEVGTENPIDIISPAFYHPDEIKESTTKKWESWMRRYQSYLREDNLDHDQKKNSMNAVNPKYVLRNYMAQLAIDAADQGDYKMIDDLHQMLKKPYHDQPAYDKWYALRPEWARHKVGCSMLSCSS